MEQKPGALPAIMIIGAGPAGMACAIELSKAKKSFCLVEKQGSVGGLSKTYQIREDELIFRTDNGPHRFFSKNKYLYDFIADLLDERWVQVRRQTRQCIDGQYFDYPIDILQVLRRIGISKCIRFVFEYVVAQTAYHIFQKPIRTFYDYAVATFGKGIAQFNIIGYTEKIWGISTRELHPDWARQRIHGLNVWQLFTHAIKKWNLKKSNSKQEPKSLVDAFWYPEYGTGTIYEAIRSVIESQGHPVLTSCEPTIIHHQAKRITAVTLALPKESIPKRIPVETLVESIHLTDVVRLLSPAAPKPVLQAAERLHYRSQVHLFVTLDKESVTHDQWIYFPDRTIPFARISEMKNFSPHMSPPGKTSLFIEFFCEEGDATYTLEADELLALALPHCERLGLFTRAEVRRAYRFQGGKDYPIYSLSYPKDLAVVKAYLDQFENLFYIGRPGRFKYTNQDHSLEMGILAARSIIDGKRYDVEHVGSEKEYFEQGYAPIHRK